MSVSDSCAIEDVLDLLLDEFGSPGAEAVAVFSQRYPEYRAELLDFAAAWAEEAHLPLPQPIDAVREARIEARAERVLDDAIAAHRTTASPEGQQRANTLSEIAAASGQDLDEVARQTGLDMGLIRKLDARRIRAETIPARLAERLALILRVDVARVRQSWAGPPGMPAQPTLGMAAFMPSLRPSAPAQESFAEAVAVSGLSDAAKAVLLAGG